MHENRSIKTRNLFSHPPLPTKTEKKLEKKKQANSQPQGVAVAPVDRMHMNIGVLNNPISGSVYAPVGEHVGM